MMKLLGTIYYQYNDSDSSYLQSQVFRQHFASQTLSRTRQKAALESAIKKRNKPRIRRNSARSRIRFATYCNIEILSLTSLTLVTNKAATYYSIKLFYIILFEF